MNEEKHCETCDCHARVCGLTRHKVVKFFQLYAFIPYIFVSIAIFTFHIDVTFSEKSIPMYWMLWVSFTFNWMWIVAAVIIPISNEAKILFVGCGELLVHWISHFFRWLFSPFRHFYNDMSLILQRSHESRIYSLEHVIADSPEASPEINENPPPLPEKQGGIVGMKELPIVYDLPPRFKRQSPNTFDENIQRNISQHAASLDTSPKRSHTSGATGGRADTCLTSGATGSITQTSHASGTTGSMTQASHFGGAKKKIVNTGGFIPRSKFGRFIAQTTSNLGAISNISSLSSKLNPIATSFDTSPGNSSSVFSGTKQKNRKCISPDTESSLLATSFGKTFDETENIDHSICQLDLSHIDVPISSSSSVMASHSMHGPYERNLLRDTSQQISQSSNIEQLRNDPQAMPLRTTQIITSSCAKQTRSTYVPFDPDTQTQNIKNVSVPDLKGRENIDSTLRSNSPKIFESFGNTIDKTENVESSICQLDLSHINVSISLPSSIKSHSMHSSYEKELSRDTGHQSSRSSNIEHSQINPEARATRITADTCVEQSVSNYVPYIPDNQPRNPINLISSSMPAKTGENVNSILRIKSSHINVPIASNAQSSQPIHGSLEIKKGPSDPSRVRMSPQSSPSDPSRVRMSPQSSPSDPSRVRMSPQSSPSDPSRVRMSPQSSSSDPARVRISPQSSPSYQTKQRISPLANDQPALRISPEATICASTHLRISPKILTYDSGSSPENSSVRQIQSGYVPFVPITGTREQNTRSVVTLPEFILSNTPDTRTNISSEHHESNLFTSSFGKTIELKENIDNSILQLDASHIHVPILPKTEPSPPQHIESRFPSEASAPGSPHLKTSPQASATGSPHLKTSPQASAPGSPHLKTSPQASEPGSPHLKTSPLASAPGSPHLKPSPVASAPGSPHLKTSPLASAPGSPHHKTSPLASAPGSPHLKTSPLASAPGSPHLKTSPLASAPGSPHLKTSPLASAPGSPHLKTSPLASAPGSPHLKTSPLASAPGSPNFKTSPLAPASHSSLHRIDSQPSSSVNLETSSQTSIQLGTSPQASSNYVLFIPNQSGLPQIIVSQDVRLDQSRGLLQSSTKEDSTCLSSDQEDENRSIDNIADNGRAESSYHCEELSEKDAYRVQLVSEEQTTDDSTKTDKKSSTSSQNNNDGIENNSVQEIEGQLSSLSSSSLSENDQNNLEGSKLRRRIRTVSEKCEIEKSVSVSTRSKTF